MCVCVCVCEYACVCFTCVIYFLIDFRPSSRASARYSLSSSDLDSYPSYRSTSSQPAFGSLDEAEGIRLHVC